MDPYEDIKKDSQLLLSEMDKMNQILDRMNKNFKTLSTNTSNWTKRTTIGGSK